LLAELDSLSTLEKNMTTRTVVIANEKGGVGKTTTAINLAQALALRNMKVLLIDLDPQGNASQGFGIDLNSITLSVADLISDRDLPIEKVIYRGEGVDLIVANPTLARLEKAMPGMTNSEMRLANRLKELRENYFAIIIDSPPTFGSLLNSALNAASEIIIPIDCNFFALMGIKELLNEVEEIRSGTNPDLRVLGYLMTLADHTKMTAETFDGLFASFGDLVFETKIRRTVKLREAPALGRSIFHHAPSSTGAEDFVIQL
jgi:chromosome partitioning protein